MDIHAATHTPVGLDAHLGLRYHDITPTHVTATLVVRDEHLQPAGLVHGGVYCAIAESVGSVAGMACLQARDDTSAKGSVVGVNNSTDFLHAVTSGVIDARAEIISAGRRTQVISIEMRNRGKLVARTTLRTMVIDPVTAPTTR